MTLQTFTIDVTQWAGTHIRDGVPCGDVYITIDNATGEKGLACYACFAKTGDPGFLVDPPQPIKDRAEKERMGGGS